MKGVKTIQKQEKGSLFCEYMIKKFTIIQQTLCYHKDIKNFQKYPHTVQYLFVYH